MRPHMISLPLLRLIDVVGVVIVVGLNRRQIGSHRVAGKLAGRQTWGQGGEHQQVAAARLRSGGVGGHTPTHTHTPWHSQMRACFAFARVAQQTSPRWHPGRQRALQGAARWEACACAKRGNMI